MLLLSFALIQGRQFSTEKKPPSNVRLCTPAFCPAAAGTPAAHLQARGKLKRSTFSGLGLRLPLPNRNPVGLILAVLKILFLNLAQTILPTFRQGVAHCKQHGTPPDKWAALPHNGGKAPA